MEQQPSLNTPPVYETIHYDNIFLPVFDIFIDSINFLGNKNFFNKIQMNLITVKLFLI